MGKEKKERGYARLTRLERGAIEEGLARRLSIRSIARSLGRSPSAVSQEVRVNRTIAKGGERGVPVPVLPEKACSKLKGGPWTCNGCRYGRIRCGHALKVEYVAARADRPSDARRRDSRSGVDRSEAAMAMAMSVIRGDVARGLSPAQISAARAEELRTSASTIYRWIGRGYCGMSDLELRRKVGYRPRKASKAVKPTAHGKARSYEAFTELGDEACAAAAEMDTVMGRKHDTKRIPTLYLRPPRFQLALLLPEKTSSAVASALGSLERALGKEPFARLLGLVITDNGAEFADTRPLERSVFGQGLRTTVHYCDVRQSQQKARCERAHVELRKLLPKGRDIVSDGLTARDLAHLMGHVSSGPRPSLGGLSPVKLFKAQLGDEADILLDALGVSEVPYAELDLTDRSIDRGRKEDGNNPLIHT